LALIWRHLVLVVNGSWKGTWIELPQEGAKLTKIRRLMAAKERERTQKRHGGGAAGKEIEDWNNIIECARGAGGFHGFHG
jgi:hypothetical protein